MVCTCKLASNCDWSLSPYKTVYDYGLYLIKIRLHLDDKMMQSISLPNPTNNWRQLLLLTHSALNPTYNIHEQQCLLENSLPRLNDEQRTTFDHSTLSQTHKTYFLQGGRSRQNLCLQHIVLCCMITRDDSYVCCFFRYHLLAPSWRKNSSFHIMNSHSSESELHMLNYKELWHCWCFEEGLVINMGWMFHATLICFRGCQ